MTEPQNTDYDYTREGRGNNPKYVVPPAREAYTGDWTYHHEVPPVEDVRALIHEQSQRWPPSDALDNGYLEVPARYSVERLYSDPDMFPEDQDSHEPMADPRWTPTEPQRPQWGPSVYRFFRPFDKDVAERYTGDHFSMATWSRNYPIYGMEPWEERRNTYRVEPPPRDVTIQDRPPDTGPNTPQAQYTSPMSDYRLFEQPSRSWRL